MCAAQYRDCAHCPLCLHDFVIRMTGKPGDEVACCMGIMGHFLVHKVVPWVGATL